MLQYTSGQYFVVVLEWDANKAAANHRQHGINLQDATKACLDAFLIAWIDSLKNYGEERMALL